jgi:signal transduction histidine kinase/ligand-binding sensor domain-containing protein
LIFTVDSHLLLRKSIVLRPHLPTGPVFRLVLSVLVALSLSKWAGAQSPVPEGQRIIHQSWTFKDGAPETVEALAQTADGYLWLGTQAGLYRFDGVRFELFRSPFGDQFPSTSVSALFAPPTGGLWVGYRFGGFSFLKNGKLTNFVEFPSRTGTVNSFAQGRDGIVWAATNTGVWRFDRSSWQQNPAGWNPQLRLVAQVGFDREGILWVLTDNRSLEVERQLFYLMPAGGKFRNAGNHLLVQGFTWDADCTILTSHEKHPPEPGSGVELESSLPAYPILKKNSEQILDRAKGIWFLPVDPIVLSHPAAEPLAETVKKVSRSNSHVYDINPYRFARLVDREGSVWIGDPGGVHRFSYSRLLEQAFPKTELNPFFALAPDEGGVVWVSAGNQNGSSVLYRVAGGKAELQKSQRGIANFAYRAPDKTFWFGGEGGLWHMVNGHLTRIELPPAMADRVAGLQTITQDRLGGMWVSFGGSGLYRVANGIWTAFGGRRDFPQSTLISEFTDNVGRVWFGYRNGTLAVLDADWLQMFGPSEGVRVGAITAIYGRGSEIWVGGEFGLQQFDQGRFHEIHAVDKESLRGISGIVERANGDLWLNGLGGIFHVRQAEIKEALKNGAYQVRGERFGRREGLPGLPAQFRPIPTALEGTDGRLWFAVNTGVVWLDPARSSSEVPPPPVTIQSVSADDRSYHVDAPIRFPARTASVQISYSAISLSDPEAIRFRYKLRETDTDWHESATPSAVSYRNLPPGSYHFVVNASDTNGLWSHNSATAEFIVLPAFYQTNWFCALCAVAFLALMWAVYQFRVRQLQRQFSMASEARLNERTRIARELHDTLLQSFQGLMFSFQAARNLLPGRTDEAIRTLDHTIREGDEAIAEGRDAIQGLRDNPALESNLEDLLRTAGTELARSSRGVAAPPAFQVTSEGSRQPLSPLLQDEIYRIAREVLRNAFRHAHASRIEAEIAYDPEFFRLRIRDNGKGIDRKVLDGGARPGHWGWPGVRERANRIGAQVKLWSEPGAGTEAELTVPARVAYRTAHRRERFQLFRRNKV